MTTCCKHARLELAVIGYRIADSVAQLRCADCMTLMGQSLPGLALERGLGWSAPFKALQALGDALEAVR